jgi:hypothetical protein
MRGGRNWDERREEVVELNRMEKKAVRPTRISGSGNTTTMVYIPSLFLVV